MRTLTYVGELFASIFDWPHAMALLWLLMWMSLCGHIGLLPPFLTGHMRWQISPSICDVLPYSSCHMRTLTYDSFLPTYLTGRMRWLYVGFACGEAFVVTCDVILPSASMFDWSHAIACIVSLLLCFRM